MFILPGNPLKSYHTTPFVNALPLSYCTEAHHTTFVTRQVTMETNIQFHRMTMQVMCQGLPARGCKYVHFGGNFRLHILYLIRTQVSHSALSCVRISSICMLPNRSQLMLCSCSIMQKCPSETNSALPSTAGLVTQPFTCVYQRKLGNQVKSQLRDDIVTKALKQVNLVR